MRTSLALLVAVFLGACGGETVAPAGPTAVGSSVETPPPAPTPSDPVPPGDRCEPLRQRFRAAMATATGTCATDDDCGCFNPVVGEAGCGGVTDATTATALGDIERDFHAASCPWPHQCGPWACEPACRAGRCVNSGSGGRVLP